MDSGLGCEHFLDEHTGKPTGLAGLWPFPIAFAPKAEVRLWTSFSLCALGYSQHLPGACLWLPIGVEILTRVVLNQPSYRMSAKAEWKSEGRGRNRWNQELVHYKSVPTFCTTPPTEGSLQSKGYFNHNIKALLAFLYCVKPYLKHLLYLL